MTREHTSTPAVGVLLVNLGSPQAPTPGAIRRYLRQFLSDRRVIELPRLLWLTILYCFVLPFRPRRIAENYKRIWTERGSPLAVHTADLAADVAASLSGQCPGPVLTEWAMCYGQPSINHALERLRDQGVKRLLVLPLYPQYSATTTGAVYDAVMNTLKRWRWVPELRWLGQYHDDAQYIDALASSVQAHWQQHERGETLLMSFHGLPARYVEQGDPYFCHCQKTARLLAEALQLGNDDWQISFQSQFGKAQWVGPSTTSTLERMADSGARRVDVICPGFSADCIETLDEIEVENAHAFCSAGGERLSYIPALNASASHVDVISQLARQHGSGWWQIDATAPRPAASEAATRAAGMTLTG